ncbi:MAG: hypothetical protein ACK5AZ_14425 [Bryobacteraceae bacterium]
MSTTTSRDILEERAQSFEERTRRATGMSLFHTLALASIGVSIALYLAGKKQAAIFVGLWPPTFEAMRRTR